MLKMLVHFVLTGFALAVPMTPVHTDNLKGT